jgi:hypothetical protein
MRKLGVWTAIVAVAGLLAGCSSTPRANSSGAQRTTSTPTSTPASTTTTSIVAGTTTTTSNTPPAGFTSAKAQWNQGSCQASAVQGQYWQEAAVDLQQAEAQPGSTSSYPTAVTDLQQLSTLPDMGLTSTQSTEFQSDMQFLNTFFGTPGLYGSALGNCPTT